MKLKLFLIFLFLLGWGNVLFSQGSVGINTTSPHQNAVLELYSTNKGFLPPRLTVVQRDAIMPKPAGLMIYNSDINCMQYWDGTKWNSGNCGGTQPIVIGDCTQNGFTGTYNIGVAVTGQFSVTVTNNSFTNVIVAFQNSDLTLSGITGLSVTATSLASATLIPGQSQVVTYTITGTPGSTGILTGTWKKLAFTCTNTIKVTKKCISCTNNSLNKSSGL